MKSPTITFRLTLELKEQLIAEAEKRALSVTEVIIEKLSYTPAVRHEESVRQPVVKAKAVRQVKVHGNIKIADENSEVKVIDAKEQARLDIAAMLERQKSKVKPVVVASFGSKRVD